MRPPSIAAVVVVSALVAGAAAAQDHAELTSTLAPPPPPPAMGSAPPPLPSEPTGSTHATRSGHTKAAHTTTTRATHRRSTRRSSRSTHATVAPIPSDGTSVSVGRHNRGRLVRAHELVESATLRFKTPHQEARFGTDELVALLERASRRVAERMPGSRLTVGNLSNRSGGRFRPHRSHQSGRDVDLAYYTVDADGAPLHLDRFYDFRRDLTVRGHDEIHYDLARNWQLVEAMVTDEVPVQWIFVARYIRTRLLEEGARQGASAEVLEHASAILSQPSHGGIHNDQFHVRIYCPAGDRPRCIDDPPIHPWMPGAPPVPAVTTEPTP
jgi:penicillin-insensitive murein endopeptidase